MPSFRESAIVNKRLRLKANESKVEFGDSSGTYDVNLYRHAANLLKTDSSLVVAAQLRIGSNPAMQLKSGTYAARPAADATTAGMFYVSTDSYVIYVSNGSEWLTLHDYVQGAVGATGPTGPQGVQGEQGLVGATGATGPQGQQGSKGDPGDTGPSGPQGPSGATGATGAAGTSFTWEGEWSSGTTYQANDVVSRSGSTYIAVQGTTNNDPATDNTNTYWAEVAVQGVQGPTGASGSQGLQGPSGPEGATGPQGTQGPSGPQGPQGLQGDVGATGPSGPSGPQGLQGDAGPVGATGATGPQGTQGDAGATGPQGPSGPQGAQGIKGDPGNTGPTGPEGATGAASTVPGPAGATGPTGSVNGAIYTFSTTTADADPGNGAVRYNNATISSVTMLYIDDLDGGGATQTTWYDTWLTGTGGSLTISNNSTNATSIFTITSVTAATGYYKIGVTYVSGTLPANGAILSVNFSRTGSIRAFATFSM